MVIDKKVRPQLSVTELQAFDLVYDVLEEICSTCSDMGCEDTCPLNQICNKINFPPHNVLMDIADTIGPPLKPVEDDD